MSLGSRGLRDLDGGPEKVQDAAERRAIGRQVRKVHIKALVAALVLTAAILPW